MTFRIDQLTAQTTLNAWMPKFEPKQPKHTGPTKEQKILAALRKSKRPLNCAELFYDHKCASTLDGLRTTINEMRHEGKVVKVCKSRPNTYRVRL